MNATLGPEIGAELLDDLGFLLVPGPPLAMGRSYLFVAIRPTPTLRHFDPERIEFWVTPGGHGSPATIEWTSRESVASDHSWGPIRVVDRVGAVNEFASFGGELIVARLPEAKICVFSSDAPIVACGGHSQDWGPLGRQVDAFLARLRAAADPRGPLERAIAQASATARYAAFIGDALERGRRTSERVGGTDESLALLERERARLAADCAADWTAGLGLLGKVLE